MMRAVVKSDTYKPPRTIEDAFSIADTLECGHIVRVKGSRGFASRRQCRECDHLKTGGESQTGNVRESWDAEQQMPIFTVVSGEL